MTTWYHGSTADLRVGAMLLPAAATGRGVYACSSGSTKVFITDREDEARDWAAFAAEMGGMMSDPRVYKVWPIAEPAPVTNPEVHSDGSPYSEWTTSAAVVVGVVAQG